MKWPHIVLVLAIAVVTSACNSAAKDQLSQCSAAIDSEEESTQGKRVFDMGPPIGVLDISTLSDRLGDVEISLDIMDFYLSSGSLEELRSHQEELRSRFAKFQEEYHYAMQNHFEYCYEVSR